MNRNNMTPEEFIELVEKHEDLELEEYGPYLKTKRIASELSLHLADDEQVVSWFWIAGSRLAGSRVLLVITSKSFLVARVDTTMSGGERVIAESLSITKLRSVETETYRPGGGRFILRFASGVLDGGRGALDSEIRHEEQSGWPSEEVSVFLRGLAGVRR